MSLFRAVITLVFIGLASLAAVSDASIQQDEKTLIKLRAWNHAEYLRIVVEGPDGLIKKGIVAEKENEILVDFDGSDFTVTRKNIPVTYRVDNNVLIISAKITRKVKTFTLSNPSRIVIDIYGDATQKIVSKSSSSTPKDKNLKNENEKEKRIDKAKKIAAGEKPLSKKEVKDIKKTNEDSNNMTNDNKTNGPDMEEKGDIAEGNGKKNIDPDDDSFVPEHYKALWSLLQAGNFYTVLKELPNYKPEDIQSLAAYHYMYGDAYRTAQKYLDAIKHFRLAYLYASDDSLKERALFDRAEIYNKLGLVYEARANYLVFINQFRSSTRLESAHLGLAETLTKMNLYDEAVKHYAMSGDSPEILFSKANALQRTGKVSEARRAYADALRADSKYPSKSPETYFFIGENMRMLGELEEAKRHFRAVGFGPFSDNARVSLGHIAMEEKNYREAITNFKAATKASDKTVVVESLYNLSHALIQEERTDEAIASLETIRNNYINSGMYKDTILQLAKLYKKAGRMKESLSLLKELVYGKQPPREAFKELENVLLAAGEGAKSGTSGNMEFASLWREVGQWLIDETREDFLLKASTMLRSEVKSFIELSTWLVENASRDVRGKAAVNLADYYAGVGSIDEARSYMDIAGRAMVTGDGLMRVKAKILHATGEHKPALHALMSINTFVSEDLDMIGSIIKKLDRSDERLEAVAFYETVLGSNDWTADNYNVMADILYSGDEKDRALKYYRLALKKNPEDEWAAYRIGNDGTGNDSKAMFDQLKDDDTILGRLAKTKLMEIDLINKVNEVY